jgi:uncharacterized protein YceK
LKKTLISFIVLLALLSACSSSLSAKEAMEQNFEYYNNKNFKAYYDMQSTKLMDETKQLTKMSREDFIQEWKKSWVPAEVIKLDEEKSGDKKGTIITATVHYPSTLLSPEKTTKTKYKLVKEKGDWKIDEVISSEEVAMPN